MVIVQIKGGLGNQLFTFATAYAAAKKANTKVIIDKQIYHTTYKLRECKLEEFNIDILNSLMKRSYGTNRISRKLYNCVHDFKLKNLYKVVFVDEKEEFAYQVIPSAEKENIYLRGYWQNFNYFHECRSDLVRMFTLKKNGNLKKNIMLLRCLEDEMIAMHIRRSDYKTFKGGKCLSLDYYFDAITRMRNIVGEKKRILVFTDDVDFCKDKFGRVKNILYISDICSLEDIEEFYVMSKCTHFIIANSSFSWWAAYLSEREGKTVIAPVVDMWKRDFYLPDWIALDASLEGEEHYER